MKVIRVIRQRLVWVLGTLLVISLLLNVYQYAGKRTDVLYGTYSRNGAYDTASEFLTFPGMSSSFPAGCCIRLLERSSTSSGVWSSGPFTSISVPEIPRDPLETVHGGSSVRRFLSKNQEAFYDYL